MSTATGAAEAPVTGATYTSFLAQLPFFVGVSAEDLAAFAGFILVRQLKANTDVVVQRQYGHALFVLMQGSVVVHAIGPDDNPVTLGRISNSGDFFGEAALLGRGERTATVTTETDCVLLEIEKHRFDLLTRRYKSVREHLEAVHHSRAIATYLRTHRYLSQLDDQTRGDLGRGAKLKMFQKGDQMTKVGDPADSVVLIKDGVVKAARSKGGSVSILAYFNTHDIVGMSDGTTRDYGLEAVGQCEIIFLQRNAFLTMMMKYPQIAERFKKDDMSRRGAMAQIGGTMIMAANQLIGAGVEVESLLVINLDRCVRCGNCVRACHARHKYTRLDRRGPIFRRRAKMDKTRHEHIMLPASCRHCRDPECMIGCPTGAIQRFQDGDVDINDNCIGCQNCARKCPYGNITMMPLAEKDRPKDNPEVVMRAIKCNLCRGYEYSNCVHECPRGAILRVDPLKFFEELALVMEAEQRDAIEWARGQAKFNNLLNKQRVRGRSTWFIPVSLIFGLLAIGGIVAASFLSGAPLRGGSAVGLPLGIFAASCLFFAATLGIRKRMRNTKKPDIQERQPDGSIKVKKKGGGLELGSMEAWTQFHMVIGAVGFFGAVAHAGFAVTGVFTTLLLVVFAIEVVTGVTGQVIYATVPSALTRLERHGLSRLVEDLYGEESTTEQGVTELIGTIHAKTWKDIKGRVDASTGGINDRMNGTYDPPTALAAGKKHLADSLANVQITDADRLTLDRILESKYRLVDIKAQLLLHRRLKRWLIAHVATACALVVLLVFHIFTALTIF
jgi:Fe-S-cluster-containing dehydrogenase component/CRP-like cAMP-binding protein